MKKLYNRNKELEQLLDDKNSNQKENITNINNNNTTTTHSSSNENKIN